MGRSRKRRAHEAATLQRGYARGEARREQIRAELEPLAPGERPTAVAVAAIIAAAIALANVAFWLSGYEVRGEQPEPAGVLVFSGLMLVGAIGMWMRRYWAVLGFQALLGLSIIASGLALLVASNLQAVLLPIAVIAASGTLFWFLVRAMARLQMPERPTRRP